MDHGHYAVSLESALTSHFMYSDDNGDMQTKCVPTTRMAISSGDAVDDGRFKQKKFTAYAVYVAYRLSPAQAFNHHAKMSRKHLSGSTNVVATVATVASSEAGVEINGGGGKSRDSSASLKGNLLGTGLTYDIEDIDDYEYANNDGYPTPEPIVEEEDEKLLEDLEDIQLRERISQLEGDHSNVKEQVWKLEHGRQWMEERLTALEVEIQALKSQSSATVPTMAAAPEHALAS